MSPGYLYLPTHIRNIIFQFFCFLLQNQVIVNQLKRQGEEINKLGESLESKKASQSKLERQVREAQRKYADLETRMKEDLMMARIRDAENTQCVAELTQKISSLEYKVRGHFSIMLTRFRPLLTTYLLTPGWHLWKNYFTAAVKLGDTFDISSTTYLPTSSYQRSLRKPSKANFCPHLLAKKGKGKEKT